MTGEPRWVSFEAVVALNREIVAKTGEPHALRDGAALQTAIRRPWNIWAYFMDRDHAVLAAALMAAIYGARAFAAGNKRTALAAASAFLEANAYRGAFAGNPRALDRAFEFFAGRVSQAGLVEWLRLWMEPVER